MSMSNSGAVTQRALIALTGGCSDAARAARIVHRIDKGNLLAPPGCSGLRA